VFDGDFSLLEARIVGDKHLKMRLRVSASGDASATVPMEAISFGYIGSLAEDPALRSGARVRLAYRLEVNTYRSSESVQLNCQHVVKISP
jgi:single-stranded-DNA-specific exonuclease